MFKIKTKVFEVSCTKESEEQITKSLSKIFNEKTIIITIVLYVIYKAYSKHENTKKELHINDNELEKFRIECETKRLEE